MANAIALFKKYIDLLDDVYKAASCSSVLDMDGSLVQAGANANEIIIPKISMDGLADYSRNGGYVQGNVEITNETVKFNYDRGRKFSVDAMDNAETAGVRQAGKRIYPHQGCSRNGRCALCLLRCHQRNRFKD